MRGKFLFGLNESFSRFRKDIFYRDGQRKPEDPPFTPAFVVSQVISFEAAQHTNKLLANSTTEEQVHSTPSTTAHKLVKKLPGRSRPGTFLTDIAFSVAASGNTTVTYAQLQARLADVVTKLITLQTSVNRLPKGTEPPDLPPIQLPHRVPDGNS